MNELVPVKLASAIHANVVVRSWDVVIFYIPKLALEDALQTVAGMSGFLYFSLCLDVWLKH